MLTGWIQPPPGEPMAAERLTDLGVVLGPLDQETGTYLSCQVTTEAFLGLEPLWGEYIWGLTNMA